MNQPIIIAFSGRKGAGKNTVAEFVRTNFITEKFGIIEYSFADFLKKFCVEVLGLKHKQCYGSDSDKGSLTKYSWNKINRQGPMTGREVMQVFGTDCVRTCFGNVWAEATVRRIKKDKACMALITDNRFPSEIETILDYPKGYIIRLTRSPFGVTDQHASESSLDNYDWNKKRCYVLNNVDMSIEQQNEAVIPIIKEIIGAN